MSWKAIDRLRRFAQREVREDLADAFDQIKAADDAIVEIALTLPAGLRGRIAKTRKSVTRSIVGLTWTAQEWLVQPMSADPKE